MAELIIQSSIVTKTAAPSRKALPDVCVNVREQGGRGRFEATRLPLGILWVNVMRAFNRTSSEARYFQTILTCETDI
jgi:hypothetical protein